MKKITLMMLSIVFVSIFLSGCLAQPPSKLTTTTLKPDGSVVTEVTEPVEESDFFESKNLKNHYANETHRTDKYAEVVDKKIEFVREQSAARQPHLVTETERVLSNVNDTLLVMMISNAPPPSNIPAPKVMADTLGNARDWASILLQGANLWLNYDNRGDKMDSENGNVKIVNDGGMVFYQSEDMFTLDLDRTTNTTNNRGDSQEDSGLF